MALRRPDDEPIPPTFQHLCVIAREQILTDPQMDIAEWSARLKARLVQLHFEYPRPEQITAALSAVEHALRHTLGPRPAPAQARSVSRPSVDVPSTPTRQEWRTMAALLRRLLPPVPAVERPDKAVAQAISEEAALDRFYRAVRAAPGEELETLRAFAELAILREAEWDEDAIRADAGKNHGLRAEHCFACRSADRPLAWHHIIQIQHGGSNALRNRQALCEPCHAAIHPWLPAVARTVPGWSSVNDIAASRQFPWNS